MEIDPKKHSPLQIIIFIIVLAVIGAATFLFIDYKGNVTGLDLEEKKSQFINTFESGDYEKAITEGLEFINKYPKRTEGYINLANAYLQSGSVNFDEVRNADLALEVLNKALAIDSENSEIYRMIGYAYEIKQNYTVALENYDQSILIAPDNYFAINARGHAYDLSGNYEKAEADYVSALSFNENFDLALLNLASFYMRTDQLEAYDVESLIDRALVISRDDRIIAQAFQLAGDLYFIRGDYEESMNLYYDSLRYDDRIASSWVGMAEAQLMNLFEEDFDEVEHVEGLGEVLRSSEEALNIDNNQTNAYIVQGFIAESSGDIDSAKVLYEDALNSVDGNISLGLNEKEYVREYIKGLIDGLDPDEIKDLQKLLSEGFPE